MTCIKLGILQVERYTSTTADGNLPLSITQTRNWFFFKSRRRGHSSATSSSHLRCQMLILKLIFGFTVGTRWQPLSIYPMGFLSYFVLSNLFLLFVSLSSATLSYTTPSGLTLLVTKKNLEKIIFLFGYYISRLIYLVV